MPIYMQFSSTKGNFGSAKGVLHGIKWGVQPVTPRNFKSVIDFHMGVVSPRDAASGLATGKRQHQPFVITKDKDTASPLLFRACCNSEVFRSLEINLFEQGGKSGSGGGETVVGRISLTNGSIVNYKGSHGLQGATLNHPRPASTTVHSNELEEFELVFQKITWTWTKGGTTAADDWLAGP